MTLSDHLSNTSAPKRILALDGGGIRGAITIGYLEKMEEMLKARHGNNPDFRLSDYFDLIGGTSTGSIIAACLAIGMSVAEVKEKYLSLGQMIFEDKNKIYDILHIRKALRARFDEKNLRHHLESIFREPSGEPMLLGSPSIRTGLCVMAKRADTNSTWTLNNHPGDSFYRSSIGENANIPLQNVVRASTAAPTYFIPEFFDVGGKEQAAFVDGGVSTANNPSLYLLMVATMQGYAFRWPTGEKNLFMISLGTGFSVFKTTIGDIADNWMLSWAQQIPDMLMQDSNALNQIIMQWIGRCYTHNYIDMQLGNMEKERLVDNPLLTFNRYNVEMTEKNLISLGFQAGKDYSTLENIIEMSNGGNVDILYRIGKAGASRDIREEHFPPVFDLRS